MSTFYLEMLTPEKTFFTGNVDSIIITAQDGQKQILANHAPIVVGLQPSMIWVIVDGTHRNCANGEGFVIVEKNKVHVLCQTMEWPEEIDKDRVKRAIKEHSIKLENAKNINEYELSKMTLMRAIARLKTKDTKSRDQV